MEKNKVQRSKIRRIKSMNELKLEKVRLRLELVRTEDKISNNFKNIRSAFTLRNIFSTITNEIATPSSFLMKAFTLWKDWMGRRKKKKKEGKKERKGGEMVGGE
jgi:hypothetical protein